MLRSFQDLQDGNGLGAAQFVAYIARVLAIRTTWREGREAPGHPSQAAVYIDPFYGPQSENSIICSLADCRRVPRTTCRTHMRHVSRDRPDDKTMGDSTSARRIGSTVSAPTDVLACFGTKGFRADGDFNSANFGGNSLDSKPITVDAEPTGIVGFFRAEAGRNV
ncbi:hypothetical protein NDU88_002657 [Pleurodeles waltl]|uniref:Uncharacterized protein n=1 Tax=Pleurodeles waltl TaxID=8319 RepID=A0AAV7LD15_PLEWA|nr:hypothetical protein NDU88_002657 [Pleurodeles waltl]